MSGAEAAPPQGNTGAPTVAARVSHPPEFATAQRVRQAAREDATPAALRELANDNDILVRAAVALNGASGPEADDILAADRDDRVRALLAGRIARLVPALDQYDCNETARHVRSVLEALALDQAKRVRRAIADAIKSMEAAPHDVVLLLAQDDAIEVSAPIIRLSPVLTDSDLLALIATPPTPHHAETIASRPQLSAAVADAIVEHADAPAIRALLANKSAHIRETTLDSLVGRAPNHADWHAPLVHRPCLSAKAVRALSTFIAADLLRVLAARTDLDATTVEVVRKRLADETSIRDDGVAADSGPPLAIVGLTEEKLLEAALNGNVRYVASLLAVAAGVSVRTVERAVDLRSAKALVSLTWRSGCSMRLATVIQAVLAQFGPEDLLQPAADGGFPLSQQEMGWQIEVITGPEARTRVGYAAPLGQSNR